MHTHHEQEIKEIFDECGIDYIIVESIDRSGVEIHQIMRVSKNRPVYAGK